MSIPTSQRQRESPPLRLTRKLQRVVLGVGFVCLAFFSAPNLSHAATNTWTNGASTGLWSTAGNWSTGAIPAIGDDVVFSASSTANCNIDSNNNSLKSFTITSGYTGTITLNSSFDPYNNYYTPFVQSGGTFIDNGDWVFGEAITLNGGIFTMGLGNSGFYASPSFTQTGGTFNGGSGSFTFSNISVSSGTFSAPTGTLTTPAFSIASSAIFNADGGTVSTYSGINAAGTVTFNNLTLSGGGFGSGTVIVNGLLSMLNVYNWAAWNGTGKIIANGDVLDSLMVPAASGYTASLPTIYFSSSGTQTFTGSAIPGNGGLPNVVVNGSGTFVIKNGMTIFGSFNTASGTVSYGTSTITFDPLNDQTLTVPSPLNIPNLAFMACGYPNEGSGYVASLKVPSGTVINVSSTFTYAGMPGCASWSSVWGGGQINIQGNVIITATSSMGHADRLGALVPIVMNGTGNQFIYATSTAAGYGILPGGLTINASGTVNLVGTINIPASLGGGWNHIAGTVNAGTSTVVLAGGNAACSNFNSPASLSGNTQFNNLEFFGDWCAGYYAFTTESVVVSTSTTPVVNGNLIVTTRGSNSAAPLPINGGTINVNGNIQALLPAGVNQSSYFGGGTATIAVVGTSTQTFTDQLGSAWQIPQLLINTPNKTALMGYGNFLLGSTTIQQGEFWIPSSTANPTPSLNLVGNLNISSAGLLGIYQPSSTLTNASTSNVTITNNGMVRIDAPHSGCDQTPSVTLTGGASNKIVWAGSGQNIIRYVMASYQSSAVPITTVNSLDGSPGGTNTNWVFPGVQNPAQLIQGTGKNAIFIAGTVTATTTWGVRPGDAVMVAILGDSGPIPPPTDNAGNTYVLVASTTYINTSDEVDLNNGGGGYYDLYLYYAKNATGTAPFAVTTNYMGLGSYAGGVTEVLDYTGVSPSSTLEAYSAGSLSANTTSTLVSSGYVNTSFPADLYVAVGGGYDENSIPGFSAPFTAEVVIPNSGNFYVSPGLGMGDFITTSSQILQANVLKSGSAILAAFRSAIIQSYPPVGMLDSATYDMRTPAALNSFTWRGTTPSGASVNFQFAVSNSPNGPWNYVGPDGTASTVYSGNSGSPISFQSCSLYSSCYSLFSNYRYFRYRVTLLSNGMVTPTVTGVVVRWSL